MAAVPLWLTKLAKGLGVQRPASVIQPVTRPDVRPGTAVLKAKNAPKPQGREITLQPVGNKAVGAPLTHLAITPHVKQLTPAAMVYALAAGVLFTLAVYNLFHGSIFNGIITLVPATALAVLSYKYIQ